MGGTWRLSAVWPFVAGSFGPLGLVAAFGGLLRPQATDEFREELIDGSTCRAAVRLLVVRRASVLHHSVGVCRLQRKPASVLQINRLSGAHETRRSHASTAKAQ